MTSRREISIRLVVVVVVFVLAETTRAEDDTHWAFQPIARPPLPHAADDSWVKNEIDAFVLSRLADERIEPSAPADRATLIRRLSLDLTGLPPAPADVRSFVADDRADAYECLVDRLLASPHFGERWGRHWLDLARYADSDGYEMDHPRPHAWRWRDWVIAAFNNDMPFDQFTIEQLAGDLLPGATLDQIVATGLHRNTPTNRENGIDQEEFRLKAVSDRVNTTGTIWLGLTLGCAECHTHKYDPIKQREYYEMFAFFNDAVDEHDLAVPPTFGDRGWLDRANGEHATTLADLRKKLEAAGDDQQREKLRKQIDKLEREAPQPVAYVFAGRDTTRETHVHRRGNFLDQGPQVSPATLEVLHAMKAANATAPNRLDLARWIVDSQNPLTARVAANHVWQHLFGAGLVRTPDDFGTRGEPPSHPLLLDWLAGELVRKNWSRKELIRLIVTSATYRQSSHLRPELVDVDPHNRLLARQNRYRLEAEIVRDQYLAASGLMTSQIGGPGFRPPLPAGFDRIGFRIAWQADSGGDLYRRGMYIFYHRNLAFPMFKTFDFPNSNVACTQRERSNTPLQALTQLNDTLVVEAATELAVRLSREEIADAEQFIETTFLSCLGREPTTEERDVLRQLHNEFEAIYANSPDTADDLVGSHRSRQLACRIALVRAVMNLDEFVTRE